MVKQDGSTVPMNQDKVLGNSCFPNTKSNPNDGFVNNDCTSGLGTLSPQEESFYGISNHSITVPGSMSFVGVTMVDYSNAFKSKFGFKLANSYFDYQSKQGIMLDNKGNDDYIKYELSGSDKLEDDENFEIKISLRVPGDTSMTKHYILHSGDSKIKLYIQKNHLFLNPSALSDYINIPTGFQEITLTNDGGNLTASVDGNTTSTKTLSGDVENLYVGAFYNGSVYMKQLNDIIDYIRIYK